MLTSNLKDESLAQPAIASWFDPAIAGRLGPAAITRGLEQAAHAFSGAFLIAAVLVALVLVPAAFLPRRRRPAPGADAGSATGPEMDDPVTAG